MTFSYLTVVTMVLFVPLQEKLPSVEQVIKRIAESEKLYENMEVKYTYHVIPVRDDPLGPPNMVVKSQISKNHSVQQGTKIRVDSSSSGILVNGKEGKSSGIHAFDGNKTRVKEGGVFNIHDSKIESRLIFRPHSYIFGGNLFAPLSVWLEGKESLRKHPGAFYGWTEAEVKSEVKSVEKINGIKCIKIESKCKDVTEKNLDIGTATVWVAPEKNYLPVKVVYVNARFPDIVQIDANSSGFFECEPNVWVPKRIIFNYYDVIESKAKEQVVDHKEMLEVSEVNTRPEYPYSFFSDIKPDQNMVTYEVSNGKITKGYLGSSMLTSNMEISFGYKYIGYVVAALLAIIGIWLFYKNK